MSDDSAVLALLPPRLQEIAGVVGVDATLKLAAASGGLRLFIPAKIHAQHPIAKAIGIDKAKLLSRRYASECIALPRGQAYRRSLVRQRALERYYAGESARQVASDLELHEITIYNWAGEDKRIAANPQPLLL